MDSYDESFRLQAHFGGLCQGAACMGWHLSEQDSWESCSCNGGGARVPHPESDDREEAVVEVLPEDAERVRLAEEERDNRYSLCPF